MELKLIMRTFCKLSVLVLIVPFMELKLCHNRLGCYRTPGLNRTFYGIETDKHWQAGTLHGCLNRTFYGIETLKISQLVLGCLVLIVPFMELKHHLSLCFFRRLLCLNRTFYGIETTEHLRTFRGNFSS